MHGLLDPHQPPAERSARVERCKILLAKPFPYQHRHRQRIAGFGTTMTGAIQAMLSEWDRSPDGQRLALDHELMQLTLRVAGQTLFSRDLIGEANALGEAFTATSEYVNYRLGHPFTLPTFVPTAANRKFTRAQKVLDRAIDEIIRARRASGSCGASSHLPCFGSPSSAANTDSESKRGRHSQSIEPSHDTNAAV